MSNASSQQPSHRVPMVRHFIACDRIDIEPGGHYSLINLIHAIKPLPGAEYPRIHPELCLFVQMTNGRGELSFQLQLLFVDDEQSTYTSKPVILNLGEDPLIVHGWPLRLQNILFERPGLYEFRLLCDGQVIAREPIVLRDTP